MLNELPPSGGLVPPSGEEEGGCDWNAGVSTSDLSPPASQNGFKWAPPIRRSNGFKRVPPDLSTGFSGRHPPAR